MERTRGHVAQLAADRGDAAVAVRHEVLGIAQPLGRHQAWPAALAPVGACSGDAFLDREW